MTEAQIGKLLGTTKDTIQKVRERTHWNSANIKPRDPVILGLCSQTDLNAAIAQANERLAREGQPFRRRRRRKRTRRSPDGAGGGPVAVPRSFLHVFGDAPSPP